MRVAFVGVKRKYLELQPEYRDFFNRYHLELPFYFARDGHNSVILTTVDYDDPDEGRDSGVEFKGGGQLVMWKERSFQEHSSSADIDVVVHWRKWFPEFYRPEAINVINCQDHSFGQEWQVAANQAFREGKLYGILCFPTWHKRNLLRECPWLPEDRAIDGLTLGVDTDIYSPVKDKKPRWLLWASDPGRGLEQCLKMFFELYRRDRSFSLNVCWPDYCSFTPPFNHPGITWHGNVPNGPNLWELFNRCGVLPYTSTFMEPSSRAHRQAMAAGSLVLYPPGMGSPSELIEHMRTGVVSDPSGWAQEILTTVNSDRWIGIGHRAREYAVSENWSVQAGRFREYFERVLGGNRE